MINLKNQQSMESAIVDLEQSVSTFLTDLSGFLFGYTMTLTYPK